MKKLTLLFITFILFNNSPAQTFSVGGVIKDKSSGEPLSYANVRVLNSTLGTSSNIEGEYEIKLAAGNYELIASYIGYKTDTLSIYLKFRFNPYRF
jgi:hypothetical protein